MGCLSGKVASLACDRQGGCCADWPVRRRVPMGIAHVRIGLLAALCLLAVQSKSHAGGGPENLILVVNSASANSLTIANHYVQLRKIPPNNVIYLDWRG